MLCGVCCLRATCDVGAAQSPPPHAALPAVRLNRPSTLLDNHKDFCNEIVPAPVVCSASVKSPVLEAEGRGGPGSCDLQQSQFFQHGHPLSTPPAARDSYTGFYQTRIRFFLLSPTLASVVRPTPSTSNTFFVS